MASRKRSLNEDEPAANGPADLGWTKQATAGRAPRAPAKSAPRQGGSVPDPGIAHGSFKVLQRTDGPFVVIDTRLAPGAQAIAVLPVRKTADDADSGAAATRVKKAAEALCLAHAKEESKEAPHVLEERPAEDLRPPVEPPAPGGEAAHG